MKLKNTIVGLALISMLAVSQVAQACKYSDTSDCHGPTVHENIVEDNWFSDTDYYNVLEEFFEGMSWDTTYPNADSCRQQFSSLLTDFYFLDVNFTQSGDNQPEMFFNVTAIISSSLAETINECYSFQQDSIVEEFGSNIFVDQQDFRTSFLFNLLANSILIREYSYDLLDHGAQGTAVDSFEYSFSLAAIIKNLIYFTSTTTKSLWTGDFGEDTSNPYIMDLDGNVIKKEAVNPLSKDDLEQIRLERIQELKKNQQSLEEGTTLFQTKEKAYHHKGLKDKEAMEGMSAYIPQNIIEQEHQFIPRPTNYQKEVMRMVSQTADGSEIETTTEDITELISILNIFFGFLDGMLNALPQDSLLGDCASDLESMRTRFTTMYSFINPSRDLTSAVFEGYTALIYTNPISVNCYYGIKVWIDPGEITEIYSSYNLLRNTYFNFGFIYTDILMLLVGWDRQQNNAATTDTNYYYYMAFYLGDFVFRFIFMAETDGEGNCWYDWVECDTATTVAIEDDE